MQLRREGLRVGLVCLALVAAYFVGWPVPIEPVVWHPAPDPGMTGPYEPNERLGGIQKLTDIGPGPEAVAIGGDGRVYTGLQDGRVMRMRADGSGAETFAGTGGRPLGMKFDAAGNLIVADAFRGLLSISPEAKVTVLADGVNGERLLFANDVAIAGDGAVWFTDSSRRFDQHHWMLDFLEGRATGRLLRWDAGSRRVEVALDGLLFANGVALGPGDEYVLVNETLAARIRRYWVNGVKAGQSDIFAAALPGYPDNLTYNGRGVFWVALGSPRNAALEGLAGWPGLRKAVGRLPAQWLGRRVGRMAWVVGLGTDGQVVHNLQESTGRFGPVASVVEANGRLYLGSIGTTTIGWAPAP